MFDSKPFNIEYVQKSSGTCSDDFLFAEIYKFFTDKKLKYIVRAEMHEYNVFTVKYYASIHKKLDNKYNRLTNNHGASKIFLTCASVLPKLLQKYPDSSFAFSASRSIDIQRDKIEGNENNQRFRLYEYVVSKLIGDKTFQHYTFESLSSYLLINTNNQDIDEYKRMITDMFTETYNFYANL